MDKNKRIERDVLRREPRVQVTIDRVIGNVECDSNDFDLALTDELHSVTKK